MSTHTRNMIYTALCITIGLLLPQFVKVIPVAYPGTILFPMHIPVLLCGFLCGWRYSSFCGLILPLFSFSITGVPTIFPTEISMMLELGTYGALTAILYRMTNGKILLSLVGAMSGGRIILGLTNTILFNLSGNPYSLAVFLSGAFITAFPGIVIQLILIPSIVKALKGSGLITKY